MDRFCVKKFKEVESTRRKYYKDPNLDSIHRASLMVPEITGTDVDISFLNHFLLKRNHENVACKITAIDFNGNKVESRLFKIEKPIVYTIQLSSLVTVPVSNYLIEFFSANNLFIPFPAVMINHRGKGFVNQVHSFNRVLNDIFENDVINQHHVKEASVDLPLTKNTDTFLLFSAGPFACKSSIDIEVITNGKTYLENIPLDVQRFGTKKISVREHFDIPEDIGGIIKAQQPEQMLFYGRMLTGQSHINGSFSANHSYYDSSTVEEYWDDVRTSTRFYPFFKDIQNIARLYPILSPSDLKISIGIFDDGKLLEEISAGNLQSPSDDYLDININSLLEKNKIDLNHISTFSVNVNANSGKMPTRIGHQLVYGNNILNSSIAVSLYNPNIFVPENKKSFKWGQIIVGGNFDSYIGIVADKGENPHILEHDALVKLYDKDGFFEEKHFVIKNGSAVLLKASEDLLLTNKSDVDTPNYIWCTIDSEHYGLNFFSVTYNLKTNHFSGDHGF